MKAFPALAQLRLRPLIVISELLLIAALAFMASLQQLAMVVVLPIGIGMVLIFLRWPSFGLLVTAVAGIVIPYAGPSGLNVTMLLVALMLGLWLFEMVVYERQIHIAPARTNWPWFALLFVAVISLLVGQLAWYAFALHAPMGAQLGGLSIFILSAAIFFLVANQINDVAWLSRIVWVFLVLGTVSIVVRSVLPVLGFSFRNLLPQVGSGFYIWFVAMAFSQAIFNQDLRPGWRLMLGGIVLLALYILFIWKYADKSGWLACFVCVAAILVSRYPRGALLLLPFGFFAARAMWSGIVSTDEYSITTRWDAWVIIGQMIKVSPIWGLGFANYYWYTPLFPIRGYAVSFNSHNNYVDIVAETGVVGLVCLLWLFWEIGRLGWRLRGNVSSGFAQAYVYGALGGLAGMMVAAMLGDWILPFFYNVGLKGFPSSMLGWFFLGGLVSVGRMVTVQKSKNQASSPLPSFPPRSTI